MTIGQHTLDHDPMVTSTDRALLWAHFNVAEQDEYDEAVADDES